MAKTSKSKPNADAPKSGQNSRKTREIVISAINKLMKNTGWTAQTIIKFIKMENTINDRNLGRRVSRALKRGVRIGILKMDGRRYRLNEISQLARAVGAKKLRRRRRPHQRCAERPVRCRSRSNSN